VRGRRELGVRRLAVGPSSRRVSCAAGRGAYGRGVVAGRCGGAWGAQWGGGCAVGRGMCGGASRMCSGAWDVQWGGLWSPRCTLRAPMAAGVACAPSVLVGVANWRVVGCAVGRVVVAPVHIACRGRAELAWAALVGVACWWGVGCAVGRVAVAPVHIACPGRAELAWAARVLVGVACWWGVGCAVGRRMCSGAGMRCGASRRSSGASRRSSGACDVQRGAQCAGGVVAPVPSAWPVGLSWRGR
jgi:hypothetical protein